VGCAGVELELELIQTGSGVPSDNKRENDSAKGPGPMAHDKFPQNGILESLSYFIFCFV
jgi:hypothetical protein